MVRPVTVEDLSPLCDLDKLVFGDLAYPYFVWRQHFDVHRDDLLVAEECGQLRGYSFAVRSSTTGIGWFLGLGVEPTSRRLGHGRRLAEASLRRLGSQRVERVLLSVARGNVAAVGLYRQLGFHPIDDVDDYFGPGEPRQLMELWLRTWQAPSNGRFEAGAPH
jgi:ribosomal protein S18 acetylase RimI-like enzyme